MTTHMSLRLAWHDHGWNGHICSNPCNNPYCVGTHSYPGDLIASKRNLELEKEHPAEPVEKYPCKIACALSVNAFGKDTIRTKIDTPKWWNEGSPFELDLPPSTACTWCFEAMYKDVDGENGKIDHEKRFQNAKDYFAQFEEKKSLVFYYAGYSNPFSEDEENNFVIVGVSRIKHIDNFFYYYDDLSDAKREQYAGGYVWQKPITSTYPDEGFCIPYWKYLDNEELSNRLVIKPSNRKPFKYGSREVTDDDAIEVIQKMIETIDVLIEIDDKTEDWEKRKEWLNSVLNELWTDRGPYPGLASVMEYLQLNTLIKPYFELSTDSEKREFYNQLTAFLDGNANDINGIVFSAKDLKVPRRDYMRKEDNEKKLLLEILPRFDLTAKQVTNIMDRWQGGSITASTDDLIENPYIIFEQYCGDDSDDIIPFYKIDNGVIPSPEYGLKEILDSGSTERLRALCVDELNWIPAHTFGKAETILKSINTRLDRMPEWKRYSYQLRDFNAEQDILNGGLHLKKDGLGTLYLYLRTVYEDERFVEGVLRKLAERPDIELKLKVSVDKFKQKLRQENSRLLDNEDTAAEYERIINKQAEVCMQIFRKPICILSGAAGTGKTTVIASILSAIERTHGEGTSFLLMAPTGKAAERIKVQTGKPSSTIHSFLAKNGWLNQNMTLKREGGRVSADINTLILDECSMIDLNLFATLFRAINWNSIQRLILVGDPNQLPPIGRGKVFADTIDWLKTNDEYSANVGTLCENIRQLVNTVEGNGTGILKLANVFIQEKQISSDDSTAAAMFKSEKEEIFTSILENGNGVVDKDLSVYFWKDQDELEKLMKKCLVEDMQSMTRLPSETEQELHDLWTEATKDSPEKFQVISPYRGEFYGTMSINTYFQRVFNGYWSRKLNIDGIGMFDKVIQIRNRPSSDKAYVYDLLARNSGRQEIYNGEIATVIPIFNEGKSINYLSNLKHFQCIFSGASRKNICYKYGKELGKDEYNNKIPNQNVTDNLELAYAISVHKSQGSEFDYVYIVIPARDSHLMSMELLYTALTRAQKHVTLFLQQDMSTLTTMSHVEKSAVRKINSSVFEFNPLPDELLYCKDWYKDEKKLATLSEYFVRSKSEVIIANLLSTEDVPFEYEKPLFASDGSMFLPDFTVTFKGEKYYWEHVGRLDLPNYRAHWEMKEKWYNENFPGKLITTYEGNNLTTEAKEIIQKYK